MIAGEGGLLPTGLLLEAGPDLHLLDDEDLALALDPNEHKKNTDKGKRRKKKTNTSNKTVLVKSITVPTT